MFKLQEIFNLGISDFEYIQNIFLTLIRINVLNLPYGPFYINLREIWFYKKDANAPSACSNPGGKQWQHSIQGWEYCWEHNAQLFMIIFRSNSGHSASSDSALERGSESELEKRLAEIEQELMWVYIVLIQLFDEDNML